MTENEPIIGETPEERLIRMLKENGPDDPETYQFLQQWMKEQEELVTQSSDPNAQIEFDLKLARIYFKAGGEQEAFEIFEGARRQAMQEGKTDLFNAIMQEMDEKNL